MIADSDEPFTRVKSGPVKYLNVEAWLKACFDRWNVIKDYDERFASANSSALDIGTGFGYFPFVGKHLFGVDTEATEVYGVRWWKIYMAATKLLEVPVHHLEVKKYRSIDLGKKYDLVTAYRIVFNYWYGVWKERQWKFFLEEVKRSLLNDEGILVLAFNYKDTFRRFVSSGICPMTIKEDFTVIIRKEDI
jgi:hypothetical protein